MNASPPTQLPPIADTQAMDSTQAEDPLKYEQRYVETKKEVAGLEQSNSQLVVKISRAKKILERLKFERQLLFEKLESIDPAITSNITLQPLVVNPTVAAVSDGEETGDETDMSVTADEPKRKRAKKKDPNAPKRPANAFFMYCQVERENVKSGNPEITRSELTKTLGQNWKQLTEDEKKKYFDLYEKDKERYASEMEKYEGASGGGATTLPDGGARKSGDNDTPPAVVNNHPLEESSTMLDMEENDDEVG